VPAFGVRGDRAERTGSARSTWAAPVPFLSLGSDCAAGPETTTMRADSWQEPGSVSEGHYTNYVETSATMPPLTGCNLLPFAPAEDPFERWPPRTVG
jgi:hypothetical protein